MRPVFKKLNASHLRLEPSSQHHRTGALSVALHKDATRGVMKRRNIIWRLFLYLYLVTNVQGYLELVKSCVI